MVSTDQSILHFVQSFITPWLTVVMRTISWLMTPEVVVPVIAGIVVLLIFRHKRLPEILLLMILGGNALTVILKHILDRPRPTALQAVILDSQTSYSFPSGHAMAAMTIGGVLILLVHHRRPVSRKFILTVSIGVTLVGVSRVYLGAHWPSDVVAGFLIGWIWLVFVWGLVRPWIQRRTHQDRPQ